MYSINIHVAIPGSLLFAVVLYRLSALYDNAGILSFSHNYLEFALSSRLASITNGASESFEEATLLVTQMCGKYHKYLGIEISTLVRLAQLWHTLPTQAERSAILRLRRNAQHDTALIRRCNTHFATDNRAGAGNSKPRRPHCASSYEPMLWPPWKTH